MSTKKKTKTKKPARSAKWENYFSAAITGLAMAADYDLDPETRDVNMVDMNASIVRRAESIADIAVGRTS